MHVARSPTPKTHSSHEALFEAKAIVTALRHRLYDQLNMVDAYAKEPSDRRNLERLTMELHGVSQDTDSLLASADMAEMIAESMLVSHRRCEHMLQATENHKNEAIKISDSWHIAMNLVYNLVTQQNSATNTTIARETKADSSSMKTIAVLTMLFLPGTFVATAFQLLFMRYAQWWHYLAVTLPLTMIIIAVWGAWDQLLALDTEVVKWAVKRLGNRG